MSNQRGHKTIAAVVFGLVAVLSNPGARAGFDVEVVQTTEREVLPYTALSYNITGEPTIAYGDGAAGEVRLATKIGGNWSTETVDSRTHARIDHTHSSSGTPAVTYITREGGGFSIFYAEKASGSWSVVKIEQRVNSGVISLAFDGSDVPSVVYDKGQKLILTHRPAGSWVNDVVASRVDVVEASLAYDANGNPTIAFFDDQRDSIGAVLLKFASKSGSSWTVETVASEPVFLRMPSLVYDPSSGEPNILYSLSTSYLTRLARRSGGSWQVEDVVSTTMASLDFDADGSPYVAYRNPTDNTQLLMAHRVSGGWNSELIDSSATNSAFSVPSLRVDGSGNPSVSYGKRAGIGAPRDLRFAVVGTGCAADADCIDANECTKDTCNVGTGACENAAEDDFSPCNDYVGICCGGACSPCSNNDDCSDGDICTTDTCNYTDICATYCDNEFDVANDPSCDVCVPTHDKEKGPRCSDGLDNDCDGWIDGDDSDC